MELTVTNRSRAYPGRSSEDSKVDGIQYVVLKVCITCIINAGFSYNIFKRYLMNFLLSCIIGNRRASAYSSIAQSVEHAAVNRAVVGSSPTRGVF